MVKLRVQEVQFSYDGHPALRDVTLSVDEGEMLGVIGPNGSGKSTLLKCINHVLQPQKGTIFIDGQPSDELDRKELARRFSYVPQQDKGGFPSTVFDTILLGRLPYLRWRPGPEDRQIVREVMEKLDLTDLAQRDVNQLSGGQRQKVLIARALAQKPQVILLDEPTNNLDLKHQLEIMNLIKQQTEKGISSLVAIHDLTLAMRYADKFLLLDQGQVFAAGGPQVVNVENVEALYGVKVSIVNHGGQTLIIPEEPA